MVGFPVWTLRNLSLMAMLVGLSACMVAGQQAGSPAETAGGPGKIYDEGPDVTAPQLLPMERTIPQADACARESDDEIDLSLIVDANGKPRDVTLINPVGTPLERLAKRIVEQDTFKPGALKGEAVEVRLKARVGIQGCYATKKDANGNSTEVFRLKAQPVQIFGEQPRPELEQTEQEASKIAVAREYLAAAAGTPGLERIGKNGVSAPVPLNSVGAEYSEEARREKIMGVCLVSVIVDTQGKPQNPHVIRALGYGLDQKALEAVRKYHFKPAMKAGVPVPVMITVEVNFRLYER
jgi:TonB family protein